MHGLHCYGTVKRTRNVSEYVLVLALCLVEDSHRLLKIVVAVSY